MLKYTTMEELAEIRLILKELALSQIETDAKFKELQLAQKATDKQLRELGKQIGGIGERFGSFIEGLAYPSMRKVLYKQYGIDNTVANYLRNLPNGREIELDAFGFTNGSVNNAVVVEIKSNLQSKHIYAFKERLQNFKYDFPDFANKHLYGILTTPKVVSRELKNEVFSEGIHLAIVHDEIFDFKPNPKAIDFNAVSF